MPSTGKKLHSMRLQPPFQILRRDKAQAPPETQAVCDDQCYVGPGQQHEHQYHVDEVLTPYRFFPVLDQQEPEEHTAEMGKVGDAGGITADAEVKFQQAKNQDEVLGPHWNRRKQ